MQGSGDVVDCVSYPTLVGHIHLTKNLLLVFFTEVIIDMCFIPLILTL
jgi:hypothetical protein